MMRIAVAQVRQTPELAVNLATTLDHIARAADAGAELVCFPETHMAGYRDAIIPVDAPVDRDGLARATGEVSALCARLGIGAIVGTETPRSDGGRPYNSAQVFDERGELIALHHKSRLTPNDAKGYSPGTGPTAFEFKGVSMGVVICFEGFRFPETTRELARSGAQVVFHPQCNHVLPTMGWKQPIHEALIMARAGENTVWFVSANMAHPMNNCRSLVVSPRGLIHEASALRQEMLVVADIEPEKANHAFLRDDLEDMARALGEIS